MSRDEARQHIRAAQEAEIAGNKEGAVLHLQRAALAYVRVGQHARAALMYKNCLRLAPGRADLQEALEKAERWAEQSQPQPAPVTSLPIPLPDDEAQPSPPIVASLGGFDALSIPRGPTRMPAGTEAWCSFCCRPTAEVGDLVAGPAGAFICTGCIESSIGLLGMRPVASEPPTPPLAPARPPSRPVAVVGPKARAWIGPEPVLRAARAALVGRGPAVVLAGPEGSGKSALLDALADEHLEASRLDLANPEPIPAGGALLVEHLELATPQQRALLRGRHLVAGWRAEVEVEPLAVKLGDDGLHTFPIARGLALPAELGPVVALALPAPDEAQLRALLDLWLGEGELVLVPALQEALLARAVKSGRGAKSLAAELGLLRTLPPGSALELAAPARRTRRKKS